MASDMCPIPPKRAASKASSAVEISTPIPPTKMGTYSFPASFRRKSLSALLIILSQCQVVVV